MTLRTMQTMAQATNVSKSNRGRGWLMAMLTVTMALIWCGAAAAQTSGRISGQVLDPQGVPYPGLTVTITSPDTNKSLIATTDKDGKFVQLGLTGGMYTLNFKDPKNPQIDYNVKFPVATDQDNPITINFKELFEAYAKEHPVQPEKAATTAQFQGMKQHFQAGLDALQAYNADHAKLAAAAAADKPALNDKIMAECQTAAGEFGEAVKLADAKDTKNQAVILANQGVALDCAGKYADAAASYQKAIDVKPDAGYYAALATDTAKTAAAQPSVTDAQLDDALTKASADCAQAITLDPTKAAVCWRNVGISFYNKSRMKQATVPFQKATAADPTYAEAWYFLGSVLLNQMDSKQEGTKISYIIQPGTQEAYQKYLELAPTGPYATEAKAALDTVATLQGTTQSTVVSNKKKH
jgi:tetratricopeptide (TPR) repeat protein